ncbi:MAG: NAD(P)-dependent oxidoreductase [Clostridiales bacterium]|nr:NAD(P)-dependent oxidoreductase [Clostridiales bacterium]
MKILVTGGSGFIGKAFIKTYRKTLDIVAPTHEQMDLTDARSIEKMFKDNKFDAVLHLAGLPANGGNRPLEADNLIMFKNIQYMAIAHGVKKLITVGEGVEFDTSRPIVDYTEDMFGKYIPTDGYGLGRYLINLLASKDKITTVLRIFHVYGEGGGLQRPINKIVGAGSRGKKQIVIDRDKVVSAISVDDAVKAVAAFLMRDYPKGDYNLVAGDKMSFVDIAKAVKRYVRKDGGDIEIVVKDPTPAPEYSASNAKLLATVPMNITSMSSGIKKLYEQLKK